METTTPAPSQLFLIRLWVQPDAAGASGWQGKLQPLLSGEAYCFADWAALVDLRMGTLNKRLLEVVVEVLVESVQRAARICCFVGAHGTHGAHGGQVGIAKYKTKVGAKPQVRNAVRNAIVTRGA